MKHYLNILIFGLTFLFSCLSFAYDFDAELGVTVSYYKYKEPYVMDSNGANIGLDYVGTFFVDNDFFMRGNIIGAYGKIDYKSPRSGTSEDEPNWYIDTRALFGRKIRYNSFDFSPYIGLGYRYLYNDARGLSSEGHVGYRRESNYLYIPIGMECDIELTGKSKFVTGVELDYLVIGMQKSYVSSDTNNLVDRDVKNKQYNGYGLRLNFRYYVDKFSIGPYMNYWYIPCSEVVWAYKNRAENPEDIGWTPYVEPRNYTFEFGLKVSYRF